MSVAFSLLSSLTCHMSFLSSAIINRPSPPFFSSSYHRKTKKSNFFAAQSKCLEYWLLYQTLLFLLHLYPLALSTSALTGLTSSCQHLDLLPEALFGHQSLFGPWKQKVGSTQRLLPAPFPIQHPSTNNCCVNTQVLLPLMSWNKRV